MRNTMRRRPTSAVRPMPAGRSSVIGTTMAVSRADQPIDLPCSRSLPIKAHKIDIIVVYKVDRLTRSLADFAKLVELFDSHAVSFVSVTQQFNTTTSMGRLTLNVLLSFAQFEREVTAERISDKIAASKRKGLWVGGTVPLGYELKNGKLLIVEEEAKRVARNFGDTWSWEASTGWWSICASAISDPRSASCQTAARRAGFPSPKGRSFICCATAFTLARFATKMQSIPGHSLR